jgi:Putative peptidoglycan binding domain
VSANDVPGAVTPGQADPHSPAGSSPASRRRRLAFPLALLLASGAVVAIVLGTRSSSPPNTNRVSAAGAANVQRRDLVETDTESGTLGYVDPQTVYDRLSGTITWLPAVGHLIKPGQPLYRVNGRPVVLLDGALPAYRGLKANDSTGRDILQLNRDLVQLGFSDGQVTIDDVWQTGTTDAVERWQASLGETQTGKIGLGRIVFLPGPQRVTQLDATCGSTGGGSNGGSSAGNGSGQTNGCGFSEARATIPASQPEFVELATSSITTTPTITPPTPTTPTTTPTTPTTTPTTTTTTTSATTPTTTTTTTTLTTTITMTPTTTTTTPKRTQPPAGHAKASGSVTGSKGSGSGSSRGSGKRSVNGSGSAKGSGVSGSGGSAGSAGSATAILQTTSTKLVVTVDLSASSQSEARVGNHVMVEMPAGKTVTGKISSVSSVAQSSSGGSGSGSSGSTIPVTVTLSGQHSGAGLDQAAVSVNFVRARARDVLSVPVTALLATAGGGYAVQETGAPHKLIAVTTGLFAAGYVQISGAGIHPGVHVTDSQG